MWANHINYVNDTYTFVANAPVKVTSGESVLDNVKAVPNPYYLFSSYDRNVLNRRMQFTNLRPSALISIFTLAGDRVAVINKDDPTTIGATMVGMSIATQGGTPYFRFGGSVGLAYEVSLSRSLAFRILEASFYVEGRVGTRKSAYMDNFQYDADLGLMLSTALVFH